MIKKSIEYIKDNLIILVCSFVILVSGSSYIFNSIQEDKIIRQKFEEAKNELISKGYDNIIDIDIFYKHGFINSCKIVYKDHIKIYSRRHICNHIIIEMGER